MAAQRRARALELRIQGKSTPDIAKELQIHWQTAQKIIRKALANLSEQEQEYAEHIRGLTQRRLESLLKAHWDKAQAGDEKATQIVLSVIDRELRLFGLEKGPSVQLNQVNLVNLPPEELVRRARMVGLELDHDPNVIEGEVVNDNTRGEALEGLHPQGPYPDWEGTPEGTP